MSFGVLILALMDLDAGIEDLGLSATSIDMGPTSIDLGMSAGASDLALIDMSERRHLGPRLDGPMPRRQELRHGRFSLMPRR